MTISLQDIVNRSGNEALRSNPPNGLDFHITKRGSDWLWAAFAVFGCFLVIYLLSYIYIETKKQANNLIRYSIASVLLLSLFEFFHFFTYASNLGWAGVQAEFDHLHVDTPITELTPGVRQVFYEKYVAWALVWPCWIFFVELANSSISTANPIGTDGTNVLSAMDLIHSMLSQIVGTVFWVVALLIGTVIHSTYKFGYWVFGAVAMLIVQFIQFKRIYFTLKIRGFTGCIQLFSFIIVWLYFICWGLSEGGNRIQPDSEAVFYGVLDVCIFGFLPAYLMIIVYRYGKIPEVAFGSNDRIQHDEEIQDHEEKTSGIDSARASGETEIPNVEQA
ncbi:opsin family protein NDAI_0K00760 [Naumovozyma dairenensis CBS 421]|uniref:30 kDa heat shock protein n=1 Tax=Naumovozyma dairenensis (strain ATCC 10597 / BCRC 20456 / CBS 421 / NBRC 0211 / NRRL Y-12639) TaxID=1071378 RepID=G0WHK6_NAUDC|nr:hypothetical protein NDAI_0K00760 [Naumovozyma dairenensis CBS 421]CCD27267.1 hypothetical protein NDAI_0K00760 [Naumovozyma dairenensis CBS 421]